MFSGGRRDGVNQRGSRTSKGACRFRAAGTTLGLGRCMNKILWTLPVLALALGATGCHRHARIHAGVEYYAPLEPAVTEAANAARRQAEADAKVIEARDREAHANQHLAEAEKEREQAIRARVAAEARAAAAAQARTDADGRAREAEGAQAQVEAEARGRAAAKAKANAKVEGDASVVIVVRDAADAEEKQAPSADPKKAPEGRWVDAE